MKHARSGITLKGKTKRILAFDLMRGFFLIVIMIDHIELYPNGFDIFTGKGRLWVSAAEGFFFMSGLLIGMMYKRRLAFGPKFIITRMWKRAAQLYVVGVGLTLVYLSWAVLTHHPYIKDSLPTPFPWHHYLTQALLMRFTYGWGDFLVRFAILMIFAPFVFLLVAKRKWWLALAGILIAWAFRGQGFTLAWQLIFNIGIIIGFHWQNIELRFRSLKARQIFILKRGFATAALISFAASYASVFVLSQLFEAWGKGSLPLWLQHVAWTWGRLNYDAWVYADKWTMGPLRIALFFIWFTSLYWVVRRYEQKINHISKGSFELLGRNSLFVYTVHSLIVFVFKLYLIPPRTSFFQNCLITGLALGLLILITMIYKKIQPSITNLKLPKLNFRANSVNTSA